MCLFGIPKDEDIVFVDRRAPRHKSTQVIRERRSHSSRPVSRVSETIIKQHHRRPSTPMSEVHRHSTSMTEIHRGPPSHRHSSSMTEIHRSHTPVPPTPKPATPVPPPASVAPPPPPPPASVGFPPGYPQAPSYRDLSPPRVPTPPEESRVELIKVEEEHWPPHSHGRSSPSAIHVSRRKSRKGSVSSGRDKDRDRSEREEIYIQRDRIIERGTPSRHASSSPSSFARRGSRGSGTPEPVQSGYRTVEGTGWDDRRPITPSGYRVVDGAGARRGSGVGIANIHREREWEREKVSPSEFGGRRGSIPYDNGSIGRPRSSAGRFAERERVVMDEGGRRREMYRRA
ncbi:uncharacterized protein Bfra_000142 [Botrytis fragariae]|uniref:Uncharacterized protein n=1 Tax=Botrytis fragariae TaxID=1964551 RepID=A0A8H6B2S0_9HELO|nr:uncharacterized protein Bfra_000142 [Botrytis fragariae]KAF5877977.1 hypothetical protein Bfra_000142 [Botrytis fragariae]